MTPEEAETQRLLDHATQKTATERPESFLGGAISYYQNKFEIDEAELIQWLGITPENLSRLKLCRRPQPGNEQYKRDITVIATRFNITAEKLEMILDGKMNKLANRRLFEQGRLEMDQCIQCGQSFLRIKQPSPQAFCSTQCLNRAIKDHTHLADRSYRFSARQSWASDENSRKVLKENYPND